MPTTETKTKPSSTPSETNGRYSWTDEQLLELIELAVRAHGGKLAQRSYEEWRDTVDFPTAGTTTITTRLGTWSQVVALAGGKPSRTPRQWTDEQIAASLREFNEQRPEGSLPTRAEYIRWHNNHVSPSAHPPESAIQDAKWKEACAAAGIEGEVKRKIVFTDTQLAGALREFASLFGTPVYMTDYRDWAQKNPEQPSMSTIQRRFDQNWNAALEAAGIDPN